MNRNALVAIAVVVVVVAAVAGALSSGGPALTELSRVERDAGLVITLRAPAPVNAIEELAAREQGDRAMVRVYVYRRDAEPGKDAAEALYERDRAGKFERKF